jgi:hypothetical protein
MRSPAVEQSMPLSPQPASGADLPVEMMTPLAPLEELSAPSVRQVNEEEPPFTEFQQAEDGP